MKAAVLHKVHDPMTIEDFAMPTITADEVLIKVKPAVSAIPTSK